VPDLTRFNETTIAGAFNVQGDARHAGLSLPATPNAVARAGGTVAFWLGPRSWLVLGERSTQAEGGAVFDVSASRVAWTLQGARAVDVLASHCPLDFHASRFPPGTCAQSLFGQVNALYYRHASREAWTLFVARSFGRDVLHHLRSAAQYGYDEIAARRFAAD
jgi:sarcosine oxidase subunit gamma